MTRRQRSGRGGKDFHGHGKSVCWCCANRRGWLGPTLPELDAKEEVREWPHEDLQLGLDRDGLDG